MVVVLAGVLIWFLLCDDTGNSLGSMSYFTKKKTATVTATVTTDPTKPAFTSPDQESKPVPASFTRNKIYYYPGTITSTIEADSKNTIVQIATRDSQETVIKAYKSEFTKNDWKITDQKEVSGQNKIVFASSIGEVSIVASSSEGIVNLIQYLKLN